MVVIGVTGSVGTGKSTVARLFKEKGADLLDADRMVHELMKPGTPVHRKIRTRFGRQVLFPDGRIDRKWLGARVFRSRKQMQALSAIVHPAVRRVIQERICRIRRRRPHAVVVLDIPLLIESGADYRPDWVVVASAPRVKAAARLKRRSGWSLAEVKRRAFCQLPLREKERKADFVVKTGGTLRQTRRQVNGVWNQIVNERGFNGRRKNG